MNELSWFLMGGTVGYGICALFHWHWRRTVLLPKLEEMRASPVVTPPIIADPPSPITVHNPPTYQPEHEWEEHA